MRNFPTSICRHSLNSSTAVQEVSSPVIRQVLGQDDAIVLTKFLTDNGQVLLANMTLYAPDGLQMIMMERFEGLTTAVDCKGDDGTMSLTFKSQDAFNYALKTWSHINQNENDKFLLIANHDGCGPDDQRQPYLITKVTEDTKDLTTFLTAQVAAWSDVAGTYDLDFGKAVSSAPSARMLKERNIITGNSDKSETVTFPMTVGKEGERTNIYTDSKGRLTLDCINCYVTGSFQVTGHLEVKGEKIKDFSIDAAPSGFAAELELEAVITASDSPDKLQFSKQLISAPIPGAGIKILGIMTLGATLSYDVGGGISFQGTGTVDFGLKSTIPDSAKAVLDLGGAGQSGATGFSSTVDPLFDVKQLSASVTLSAFSQPKLSFGIDITKIGKAEASLSMKLPEVSVTLEADYEESGVCSQNPGSSKTGVKLSSDVTVELDADAELQFGDSDNPSWSKQLWTWSHDLPGACYPINIPGLGPTHANVTSVPTLPSASITTTASGTGSPSANGSSATSVTHSIPSAVPIKSHSKSLYIPSGLSRTRSSFPTGTAGSSGFIRSKTTNLPMTTSGSRGNSTLSRTRSAGAGMPTAGSNGNSTLSRTGAASANGTSTVASTTASATGSGMSGTYTPSTGASHSSRFTATTSASGITSLTQSTPLVTITSPSSSLFSPSSSSSASSSPSSAPSSHTSPATSKAPTPSHKTHHPGRPKKMATMD